MKAGIASRIATAIRTQALDAAVIAEVVGIAVAYAMTTPANAADSPITFWNQNLQDAANKAISELGEHLIFNSVIASAIAKEAFVNRVRSFWVPAAHGIAAVGNWSPQAQQAYRQTYVNFCEEFGNIVAVEGVAE